MVENVQPQVKTGFLLSIVAGGLITAQGTLHIIRSQWGLELGLGELRRHTLRGVDFKVLGLLTLVLGVMVLFGAFLMHRAGREREGSITVIVFSILTISAGGGYLAGLILGVVGGAITLSHYQSSQEQTKN